VPGDNGELEQDVKNSPPTPTNKCVKNFDNPEIRNI
jgi:hypothetical protein